MKVGIGDEEYERAPRDITLSRTLLRSFEDLLDKAIKAYTNRSIEAAEIIQQLIELAKKMQEEQKRGTQLNITEEEIAFYGLSRQRECQASLRR